MLYSYYYPVTHDDPSSHDRTIALRSVSSRQFLPWEKDWSRSKISLTECVNFWKYRHY